MNQSAGNSAIDATSTPARSKTRWLICALLFGATTINLMNRQVFGILAPDLQHRFEWTEVQYGYLVAAFQLAYSFGLVAVGRLIDRFGTRLGYATIIGLWSLVTIAHGFVRTALGFGIVRILLGLSEAGNFPAAAKGTAEWFPIRERSLVAGIMNAGTNMGVIAAALLVPWLSIRYGWQSAFVVTGFFGVVCCGWWWFSYRTPDQHPRVSAAEYALITGNQAKLGAVPRESRKLVPSHKLLRTRQLWAFTIAKFLVDPVWFFYLSWLPKFLNKTYHLPVAGLSLPLVIIYLCSDMGSIVGGWWPGVLVRAGKSMSHARRRVMLPCALAVLPMVFGSHIHSLWLVVAMIGIALAAQQGWSANVYAIASDLFPNNSVASVVGFGSMAGSIAAALFAVVTGWILQTTGSYLPIFIYSASAYLVAFGILQWLVPNLERAELTT